MMKLLLVIGSDGGTLAAGGVGWRAIQAQEAASSDDTTDAEAESAEDETAPRK